MRSQAPSYTVAPQGSNSSSTRAASSGPPRFHLCEHTSARNLPFCSRSCVHMCRISKCPSLPAPCLRTIPRQALLSLHSLGSPRDPPRSRSGTFRGCKRSYVQVLPDPFLRDKTRLPYLQLYTSPHVPQNQLTIFFADSRANIPCFFNH